MTKERYEAQPLTIPCACGCDTMLPPLNKLGLPSNFVKGHSRRGVRHTDEARQKISEKRIASAAERRGDNPTQYWKRFEDPRYRALRKEVLARDNYTCVSCGMVGRRDGTGLYVDHILEWATHASERYNPENCQSLCYKCHCNRHGWKVAKHGDIAPPQPCACGCGGLTKPGRTYINGHSRRGRKSSPESIEKMRKTKTKRQPQPCACGCGQLAPVGRLFTRRCKQTPRGAAVPGTLSDEARAKWSRPKSEAHRAAISKGAQRRWAKHTDSELP